MVDVERSVSASDVCSMTPVMLLSVKSNEPDDAIGKGDGNTVQDIQGPGSEADDFFFRLCAERDGKGSGRVYTVTYRASDSSANESTAAAIVLVPHDKRSE